METPAGFTKVEVGQYTKGDYEYIVNPTTGSVAARKTTEEGGGEDSGSGSAVEHTIVGRYRDTLLYFDGSGMDYYFEFLDNGVLKLMFEDEDNPGTYVENVTTSYTFDENTNTAYIQVPEEDQVMPAKFIFTENNKGFYLLDGSGFGLYTLNEMTDVKGPTIEMLGTYVGENSVQIDITSEELNGHNVGLATVTSTSTDENYFVIFGDKILSTEANEISFEQRENNYVLIVDGDEFIKQ